MTQTTEHHSRTDSTATSDTDVEQLAFEKPESVSSRDAPQSESVSSRDDEAERLTAVLRDMPRWCWILLSAAIVFANVLVNLDSTIVANLQSQILQALGSVSKFPWINPIYSLGNVGSSLLW